MKRRLALFLLASNQGIYEVQRGSFRCYPCKVLNEGESAAKAAYDTFDRGRFYLHGLFPSPIVSREDYTSPNGVQVNFEFNGEPVVVEYYILTNYVDFVHRAQDLSFLPPDIFVSYFETHHVSHHTCAA